MKPRIYKFGNRWYLTYPALRYGGYTTREFASWPSAMAYLRECS